MTSRRLRPVGVLASTALAQVLYGPCRRASVLGVGRGAAYLSIEAQASVLAVVAADAVRLPNALVLPRVRTRGVGAAQNVGAVQDGAAHDWAAGLDLEAGPGLGAELRRGAVVRIGDGQVRAGPIVLRMARWWDPRPALPRVSWKTLACHAERLEALLPPWDEQAPHTEALRASTERLTCALAAGDDVAASRAATAVVGLGPGLTPAGDDVLAGTLAALRLFDPVSATLAGAVLARVAPRLEATTALSAALLRHAATGQVALPVARVCQALAGRGGLEQATRQLLLVGHTSGHDLARGLVAGVRAVLMGRGETGGSMRRRETGGLVRGPRS